jgi:hypothetical protein
MIEKRSVGVMSAVTPRGEPFGSSGISRTPAHRGQRGRSAECPDPPVDRLPQPDLDPVFFVGFSSENLPVPTCTSADDPCVCKRARWLAWRIVRLENRRGLTASEGSSPALSALDKHMHGVSRSGCSGGHKRRVGGGARAGRRGCCGRSCARSADSGSCRTPGNPSNGVGISYRLRHRETGLVAYDPVRH